MNVEKIKVLYIEDETDLIDLVTLLLERSGKYTVFSTYQGEDGIKLAKEHNPDVILLDLMMPKMDGWEVYRQIREDEVTKLIPIVIVTAKAQGIDKVLGLEIAKVDGYITKPFDPIELFSIINEKANKY